MGFSHSLCQVDERNSISEKLELYPFSFSFSNQNPWIRKRKAIFALNFIQIMAHDLRYAISISHRNCRPKIEIPKYEFQFSRGSTSIRNPLSLAFSFTIYAIIIAIISCRIECMDFVCGDKWSVYSAWFIWEKLRKCAKRWCQMKLT